MPAPVLKRYICPWCQWDCDLTGTRIGAFYICRNKDCNYSCRADWRLNQYVPSDQAVETVRYDQRPEAFRFGRKVA